MQNLLGQTVRLASKDKQTNEQHVRVLFIDHLAESNGVKYYSVIDKKTGEQFYAHAAVYDQYFLTHRTKIEAKNFKGSIQNQSQIDYKK